MHKKKLKIGIIIDDEDQSFLINDFYKKSLESNCYSVVSLIIQKTSQSNKNNLLSKLINYTKRKGYIKLIDGIAFKLIEVIETQILKKKKEFADFFLKQPISKFEVNKLYVNPEISPSGVYYKYKNEDINEIKNLNLDLLIRGGSGILQGDILNICPFGIISFHHGDSDFYRGGPPGFWEVYKQESSTGFVIQRLTEDLDGGDVIFKGHIPTSFFYKLNVCKLYLKSSIFMHKTLEKLSLNYSKLDYYPPEKKTYKIYKIPKFYQSIFYLIKTSIIICKKLLDKLFGRYYRWNVCYQFIDDWTNPILKNSNIIKNPKHRFLADPFVIKHKDRSVIFVEDFDFKTQKGRISAYEITFNECKEIGCVIEENFHLSYPFLFHSNDELFMLPETHEANDIRIYKCVEFPHSWKLHKILIKNVKAVDTNIFKFKNKYWLFTNLDSSNSGDYSSELHIFYSDSIDTSNWKSHPLNPVIFDSKKARNGGMIYSKNDELYRVFQKQDFDMYGASLGVSKIKQLSEEKYEEELFINVLPDFDKKILGIHSLTFNSNILVNDFVRKEKID